MYYFLCHPSFFLSVCMCLTNIHNSIRKQYIYIKLAEPRGNLLKIKNKRLISVWISVKNRLISFFFSCVKHTVIFLYILCNDNNKLYMIAFINNVIHTHTHKNHTLFSFSIKMILIICSELLQQSTFYE